MIEDLEIVALTEDMPEHHLKSGDTGTVVDVYRDGEGYQVEFITLFGETIGVIAVQPAQIRRVGRREIANARPIEA